MKAIPVQRLLTHEANHANVTFFIGESDRRVPAILVFSPSWSLPLIAAYAKALAILALGGDAHVLFDENRFASKDAPLGFESHLAPIDGSAQGLLRAAFVTRAVQEAFGCKLVGADDRVVAQQVNWGAIVEESTKDVASLSYRLLHAQTSRDLMAVARDSLLIESVAAEPIAADAEPALVSLR